MFEIIKMYLFRYKYNLRSLRFGMMDAENNYLNDKYTLKDFVEIIEHRIRVGSAPIINKRTLFNKYILDFCRRYGVNRFVLKNQIRKMKNPNSQQFNGNQYFSETNG